MSHDWTQRPVGSLKGVGPELERKLERLGLHTAGDLIHHYPRRYDDFSKVIPIRAMRPGNVTFKGEIEHISGRYARARKLHITEAIISDGTGTVKAVWFNQSYLAKSFTTGATVLLSGQLKFKNNDLAMQSPAIEAVAPGKVSKDTARIVPVYPETEGLSSKQLRGLVMQLLPLAGTLAESLPEEVVAAGKLMPLNKALQEIHFPTTQTLLNKARARLTFEQLWYLMLTSLVIKHEIKTESAPVIPFNVETARAFVAALEFELTPAQKRSAWEIFQDLGAASPMNRLLEGDVGSGKTLVAAMAAVMTMTGGFQAALMVPTEVLARQHAEKLTPLLAKLGFGVVLLTGRQPAAERQAASARIATGEPLLVVGTQALLGDKLELPSLGLVIIDEQHRFGVAQRTNLKAKAGRLPHLLSMTATPIPRTLQLTVYGDLDISVIDTLPPGRKPITTKVLDAKHRAEAYTFIDDQIAQRRQVFVVCPLIDDSPELAFKSVTAEYDRLRKGPFKHRRLGLMHGRLAPAEKQAVMDEFAAGRLDMLVATTVIEVGIDVPNASVMLVDGAERFGLAALHQLRGRVGRGEHPSYCFLVAESKAPDTLERLGALEKSQDGFRLAQIDLELRGPGAIYGRRQHGTLDVQLLGTTDPKLLAQVRGEALKFLTDPAAMVKYPHIAAKVNALKAVTSLD
ncbi:MAG TPA: ATP-dependent DNA helicase RecG [Candidatus Saccharimonadia bacterium]|nr:ATP-dependent DNA helicase RecG [Candidatus Saccharimonadia bacterium]